MKKFTIALLCTVLAFSATGCSTSALKSSMEDISSQEESMEASAAAGTAAINYKNVSNWDNVTGNAGQMYVSVKYPTIEIGDYVDGEFVRNENYGDLAAAIDEYNRTVKSSTLETADHYADLAKQDMAQNHSVSADADEYGGYDAADMDGIYYADEITASVTRSDSVAFSILNTNYSYAGGAHPYTGYTTVNYDSKTGKTIDLKSILTDPASFPALLRKELEKQYSYFADSYLFDDPEETIRLMLDGSEETGALQWTFGPEGITVFISPYELAPYAVGPAFVQLSFCEYPELVQEKYRSYPDNYGISVTPDETVTLKYGDGTTRKLTISQMPDQENAYASYLSIKCDQSTYQDPGDLFYSFDLYLVKNQGSYYLYADGLTDNDWHTLMVYDLNGGKITKKTADDGLYGNAPADPSLFVTQNRTDLLSTYSVMHMSHVGKDGLPVSDDEMYRAQLVNDTEFKLTAKKDIAAEVKKSGEESFSEGTIYKGVVLVPYQTDMKDTVVLKDKHDTLYKVTVTFDDSEWMQSVNGEDIEELFEGVRFAG